MAEIRSTLEIALEKADRLGKAKKEELEQERWQEEGKRIAARFLHDELKNLREKIGEIPPGSMKQAIDGATDVLVRNIVLPRDPSQWDTIKRAINGIIEIKGSPITQVTDRIMEILRMYEQTANQYKQQLKMQFQAKISGLKEALAQQYGEHVASNLDVESIPEFQQEWSKYRGEIESQFNQQLDQMKDYIRNMAI